MTRDPRAAAAYNARPEMKNTKMGKKLTQSWEDYKSANPDWEKNQAQNMQTQKSRQVQASHRQASKQNSTDENRRNTIKRRLAAMEKYPQNFK